MRLAVTWRTKSMDGSIRVLHPPNSILVYHRVLEEIFGIGWLLAR